MQVMPGEKIGIKGPSGCGKSSLLRCIMGLVVPRRGVIRIFGQPLDATNVWQARRTMAYVPQEPDFGTMTARNALELPFAYRANASQRDNLKRLPAWCADFGLPNSLLDHRTDNLSGGEKQRLALVAALLLRRPLLLLDEITSGLDEGNRAKVIAHLTRRDDLTILAVSHDPTWLAAMDRIVELPQGRDRPHA